MCVKERFTGISCTIPGPDHAPLEATDVTMTTVLQALNTGGTLWYRKKGELVLHDSLSFLYRRSPPARNRRSPNNY